MNPSQTKRIIAINGSIHGREGNSQRLLEVATEYFGTSYDVTLLTLAELRDWSPEPLADRLRSASGFLFATGTYWDSWGSPLQQFLEVMTPYEGTDVWLGKPAGVIVSMHSVGGKAVLSRLQGVLSTLGLFLPPMSGLVLSAVNNLLIENCGENPLCADLWNETDIETVVSNVVQATEHPIDWTAWPVDRSERCHAPWILK